MDISEFYNNVRASPQSVYDSYNNLMFSADHRVFNKMAKKIELYLQVKDLPGDIVEVGVFKGAGLGLFLNLKAMYEPNSLMKVIGFDFFNPGTLLESLDGLNKTMMETVVSRVSEKDISLESVTQSLSKFNEESYLLVQGDAVTKCREFNASNPGARIKLLYMDIDVGEPTYEILSTLWKKVVKNGIIVFDEYAYHKWDESDGVDKFLKDIKGEYEFVDTKIYSPTAYIRKI
jgi:hypothetical protein